MNRIEEIRKEALSRYPEEPLGTKAMMNAGRRKVFEEGAVWADGVPSAEAIDKVVVLRERWINYMLDNEMYVNAAEWIRDNW